MSVEMVKEYLAQFGAADRVRGVEASTATVEVGAQGAGVEPGLPIRGTVGGTAVPALRAWCGR